MDSILPFSPQYLGKGIALLHKTRKNRTIEKTPPMFFAIGGVLI